jgi:adenylylsulfate kinase-like enzyme
MDLMPKPKLTVTVAGPPGAGKSTVAAILDCALATAGVAVEVDDPDGDRKAVRRTVGERLAALRRKGLSVRIEMQHTSPPPRENP